MLHYRNCELVYSNIESAPITTSVAFVMMSLYTFWHVTFTSGKWAFTLMLLF